MPGRFELTVRRTLAHDRNLYKIDLSLPKIPSGPDSHPKTESSHHWKRCLQSCTRSEYLSPTCSSRGVVFRLKTCSYGINLMLLCGTRAEAWSGVGCGAMHDGQSQNTRPGEETSSTIKNLRVKTQSTEMPTVTPLA
jgi:hypothetical protein